MFFKSATVASLLSLASAANTVIQVGQTGNSFTPNTATAAIGDTITFQFTGASHSVVESSFDAPCSPLTGGFSVPDETKAVQFIVNVTSTDPIYFYCSVFSHCAGGMVGIINPGAHSINDFTAAAQGKVSGQPPNSPQGGVFVDSTGVTSTAAGAGTTPTTAASTAAGSSSSMSQATSAGLGYIPTAVPAAFAVLAGAVAAMV